MEKYNNLNRSFARSIGKSLSEAKKDMLKNDLPKYLYDPKQDISNDYKKTFLEIGFGMGEHFAHQVKMNPDHLYIGVEVYLNGVANFLKQAKNLEINNFRIWADDLDLILEKIPANSLDGIYILFPDPWHKRRYLKKRIFNVERLEHFQSKLREGGFIAFASDIEDYFTSVYELLHKNDNFTICNEDSSISHNGYIQTKYHSKAIREGRKTQFTQAVFNRVL
jgi:release factor glutamine methyltransferase